MTTARRLTPEELAHVCSKLLDGGRVEDAAQALVIKSNENGDRIPLDVARERVAEVAAAPVNGDAGPPAPLFDPAAYRFDRFLEKDPPERRMLIPDFLPLDVVGLLAGMGGIGKDMLLYMLAMSISTGVPFLRMPVGEVGGALLLAAEDDDAELHRRGLRTLEHVEALGNVDRAALSERLIVASRVSDDNLLTSGREGEVARTVLADRLIATAQRIPDLKLIALSPVSRFRGGKANAEEDTTRFVEVLEAIRAETGATVIAAVHVNQASIRDPGEADQTAVRGSTALVDGTRWVATMQRLRKDGAPDYGIDSDEARHHVRLDLVKANYIAPWLGMWLRRLQGGVFEPVELHERREARRQAQDEARYINVVTNIQALLRREGPMTRNALRPYVGKSGVLGAGDQTVRSIVERAVEDGSLTERLEGDKRLLHPPEGDQ